MDPEIRGVLILCGYLIPFLVPFLLFVIWALCRSGSLDRRAREKAMMELLGKQLRKEMRK